MTHLHWKYINLWLKNPNLANVEALKYRDQKQTIDIDYI